MIDMEKFGRFIAEKRKEADMTQSMLADLVGVTRQAVSKYEMGDSFPDISVLVRFSEIFHLPVDALVKAGSMSDNEAKLIKNLAEGKDITDSGIDTVLGVAPLLRPSVLDKIAKALDTDGIDMSHITELANYMNSSSVSEMLERSDFSSIRTMDRQLVEKLVPLLGPSAVDVILSKIIEGELDISFLELIVGYINISLIEAAVVEGIFPEEALSIMNRYYFNRYDGKLGQSYFTCPHCSLPLNGFYPGRCKCGHKVSFTGKIAHFRNGDGSTVKVYKSRSEINELSEYIEANGILVIIGNSIEPSAAGLKMLVIFIARSEDEAAYIEHKIHSKCDYSRQCVIMNFDKLDIISGLADTVYIGNQQLSESCMSEIIRILSPAGNVIAEAGAFDALKGFSSPERKKQFDIFNKE